MSSEKTPELGLHKWAPTDYVRMDEFNDNFEKLDVLGGTSDQLAGKVEVVEASLDGKVESDVFDQFKTDTTTALADMAINVRAFGAIGDGVKDDTLAIQSAINHANSLGGGVVYFPPGTYIVSPNSNRALYVHSNMVLRGAGYSSIIKVRDDAGNFQQVLSSPTNGSFVENIIIEDLTFDNNIENNISSVIGTETATKQYTISLRNFRNVKINRVKFLGSGTNTVILGSFTERSKYASVLDCHFEFKKRPGQVTFDNTMLYTNCYHVNLSGNTFEADGNTDVYTAFEVHGGPATIDSNKINNVRNGFHITSDSPQYLKDDENNNISIINNVITNAANGFFLWALSGTVLKNVVASNNAIQIKQSMYHLDYNAGISFWRESVVLGDFKNIILTGNTVSFEMETEGRVLATGETKYKCVGIGISPFGNVDNVIISNSIVENAPVVGLSVGENAFAKIFNNIKIHDNEIINSGNNPLVAPINFRTSIYATGILKNVTIENNSIIDDTDDMVGYNAYSLDPKGGSENLIIRKNETYAKNGSYRVIDTGSAQVDDPIKIKYSSTFPPVSGNYDIGDIIYNIGAITPGASYVGYKCITKGTGGTLSGVTATYMDKNNGGASYPVVMMSDASKIKTGNRILISGVGGWWNVIHVAGNEVTLWTSTSSSIPTTLSEGSVSFYAPVIKPFGLIEP